MKRFSKFMTLTLAAVALLGGCGKGNDPDDPTKPINPTKPEPETPTVKTYAVGDYYEKNFVKGIVVSTDEKGEHGLIVSLKEFEGAWALRNENVMNGQPGTGAYNTGLVQKLDDWKNYYPAFERATSLNVGALKDWFLPSMNELAHLYKAYTGHETNDVDQGTGSTQSVKSANASEDEMKAKFNKILTDNKGTALSDGIYWSSNESGPSIAYAFNMASGSTITVPNDLEKKNKYRVRPMASF